jgi:hypothetical protein
MKGAYDWLNEFSATGVYFTSKPYERQMKNRSLTACDFVKSMLDSNLSIHQISENPLPQISRMIDINQCCTFPAQ